MKNHEIAIGKYHEAIKKRIAKSTAHQQKGNRRVMERRQEG